MNLLYSFRIKRMIMNNFINTVSVRWDSPRTSEVYNVLVRTDRKILSPDRPELVCIKEFSRIMNSHYVEKGYSRYHQNQVVDVLHNNIKTFLLESGMDLRIMQELLVQKNFKPMEIYTHISHQAKQKKQTHLTSSACNIMQQISAYQSKSV